MIAMGTSMPAPPMPAALDNAITESNASTPISSMLVKGRIDL